MARKRPDAVSPEHALWLEGLRERVRALRAERNLSVRDAADLIGLPFASLHKFETGDAVEPSVLFIRDVADGYGVRFEWLVCGCGEKDKPKGRKGKK